MERIVRILPASALWLINVQLCYPLKTNPRLMQTQVAFEVPPLRPGIIKALIDIANPVHGHVISVVLSLLRNLAPNKVLLTKYQLPSKQAGFYYLYMSRRDQSPVRANIGKPINHPRVPTPCSQSTPNNRIERPQLFVRQPVVGLSYAQDLVHASRPSSLEEKRGQKRPDLDPAKLLQTEESSRREVLAM